jgi:hypothetical protein
MTQEQTQPISFSTEKFNAYQAAFMVPGMNSYWSMFAQGQTTAATDIMRVLIASLDPDVKRQFDLNDLERDGSLATCVKMMEIYCEGLRQESQIPSKPAGPTIWSDTDDVGNWDEIRKMHTEAFADE